MNKLESVEYRLVKRLFKDYNKDVRPKKDPTKAIYVDIAFYLGKIDQLNEKEQYLMSYGWLGLSWFDEFLKWNKTEEKVDYIIVPYDKVWLPELCLKNSITESNDLTVKLKYKIKVQHNGNVVYVPGANFLTSCKVQLTYFPFDVQVCHLEFVKWMTFNDQMEYRNSTTDVNLQLFVQNHEWTILETKSGVKPVIVANKGGLDLFYATIVLKRKPLYYTMTLTFPLCLTTILTFYMFLLPCESGEKVSLGISVLLSYSVLLLLISDILPRNSETAPLLSKFSCIILNKHPSVITPENFYSDNCSHEYDIYGVLSSYNGNYHKYSSSFTGEANAFMVKNFSFRLRGQSSVL
ncbi:DgyrCDS937 [Dimorphilus gyrociliatus]|uniref:DgyrCDS937 n=1 Tax=Dimorphilus gyrociliatus TaxID=2664684 RepID=A0A7I8V8N4_9ANNE|nr:DgyrCDS937 [Dimorphilus gyrociliatus]